MLDEHFHHDWEPGGRMDTEGRRHWRRKQGHATWRLVRYADDFVILVFGTRDHAEALHEETVHVLAPVGLRLSPGRHRSCTWTRSSTFWGSASGGAARRGTADKWHLYTFIGARALRTLRGKIRALTHRSSQIPLRDVLIRINQITRGWAAYFRHAVAKHTRDTLSHFVWWRVIRMLKARRRWRWRDVRRWLRTPRGWRPIHADGVELFDIASTRVTRYRRRNSIPTPWTKTATVTA
ncbi:group II intron maturase-specific domain-containing protein [Streptomyces sp. NPDC059398]|uniref:group II intron maturase-specific domain-containing protein n=1 Tax=Streptomyces sp. NPDC059398 TaxID=3346820 RepID=UPI0036ADB418